jgi:enoyl-CoA hydratase/carnithine racemase
MAEEQYETILVSRKDGIARITLNRPEIFNPMSPQLMHELKQALDLIAGDDAIRAVVITGAGKAFCAGGDMELDLAQVGKMSAFEWRAYDEGFCKVIKKIYWAWPWEAAVTWPWPVTSESHLKKHDLGWPT